MKPIELIGHVDEQHRLHVELPSDVQPGPVKVRLEPAAKFENDEWRALINHTWVKDWSDSHEDIYRLDDGEPDHGAR